MPSLDLPDLRQFPECARHSRSAIGRVGESVRFRRYTRLSNSNSDQKSLGPRGIAILALQKGREFAEAASRPRYIYNDLIVSN
jgi:hypothetical protein